MIINGYTAEHMQEIEDGTIVSGAINGAGHLMLIRHDGTQVDAGYFGLSAEQVSTVVDFNNYTTPGTYLFTSSASVGSSTNKPDAPLYGFAPNLAGFLLVEGNGGTFVKQTWTNYNKPADTLIRTRYNTTTWYGWLPPANLATMTQSGLIEIATGSEAAAMSDNTRAVSPAALASLVASQTAKGLVEVATSAEIATGTDDTRMVSPAGLRSRENAQPAFQARQGSSPTLSGSTAWAKIPFTTELVDRGGCYDAANARFVAPFAGYFELTFSVTPSTSTAGPTFKFYVNGSQPTDSDAMGYNVAYNTVGSTRLFNLAANDYVEVWWSNNNNATCTLSSTFGGYFSGKAV